MLQAEQSAGYSDTTSAHGVSRWVEQHLHDLSNGSGGPIRRLSKYSDLSPDTRRRLVEQVLDELSVRGSSGDVDATRSLDDLVTALWGIGRKAFSRLDDLGIVTVGDLLLHVPRRYLDRSAVVEIGAVQVGEEVTVVGEVVDVTSRQARSRRLTITEAVVQDSSGQITGVWFNQPYLANSLSGRRQVALSGRAEHGRSGIQLASPDYELDAADRLHAGRLVPAYPLTAGVTQRQLRRWVSVALDSHATLLDDLLPEALRRRRNLPGRAESVVAIHRPESPGAAQAACRRLAFDELLVYQLAILTNRRRWREGHPGESVKFDRAAMVEFGAQLPFELTPGQRAALVDVLNDLRGSVPMSRLIQGDVGSGKTVVAAGALFAVCRAGWQGAMMAPTEILAEQHESTIRDWLEPLGVRVERIAGGVPAATRRRLWRDVDAGEVGVVVGTQALIQQSARFARLNLAVVDEQHRFGVQQRGEIRAKGYNPHLLAMTATPIPRTLALTLYGDLDISSIREMPRGRQPIRTVWVPSNRRDKAYAFVRQQIRGGGRVFVICPLIQESEDLQVRSAIDEHNRLITQVYPDLAGVIGLVHGRMSARAKDAVMRGFRDGEFKILVSTAVVEVGIDVPQATVMMIEAAERFGLSQLHQLRGRVGRSAALSHCFLLSDSPNAADNARLKIMQNVHDGFELAERDLDLRGPGDVLGTRQHGLKSFKFANVMDIEAISETREDAEEIMRVDSQLERPDHAGLAAAVQAVLRVGEWN